MNKVGLVLGKFYPPHAGHLHVIKYAEKHSPGGVLIIVGSLPTETIPSKLRCKWLRKMVGKNTIVLDVPDDSPGGRKASDVSPKDEQYWIIWRENLMKHILYESDLMPTTIFGSEPYIKKLAYYMDMQYEIVDIDRTKIPVSATMIRSDPLKYWEFIPDVVKPYYKKLLKIST